MQCAKLFESRECPKLSGIGKGYQCAKLFGNRQGSHALSCLEWERVTSMQGPIHRILSMAPESHKLGIIEICVIK